MGPHSHGYPLQSTSIGVDIFFSLMRSYFCLFVAALSPCQGSEPRLKYMRTYPRDSRSSRLDCSVVEKREGNCWSSDGPGCRPTSTSAHRCPDECWLKRNEQCPWGFYSPGRGCVGAFGRHGTSWPGRSQWCTPGCPFCRDPSGSCQASHLGGWSSWSVCIQFCWSAEDQFK